MPVRSAISCTGLERASVRAIFVARVFIHVIVGLPDIGQAVTLGRSLHVSSKTHFERLNWAQRTNCPVGRAQQRPCQRRRCLNGDRQKTNQQQRRVLDCDPRTGVVLDIVVDVRSRLMTCRYARGYIAGYLPDYP